MAARYIVGSGGVGKTQTALRVASGLRGSGIFGARFVGLASLDASGSVVGAIASALGVQEQTGRSLEHALLAYLRNKNLALVLDNCEHVAAGAAAAAAALLAGCPRSACSPPAANGSKWAANARIVYARWASTQR